jgi:hypothetical protein
MRDTGTREITISSIYLSPITRLISISVCELMLERQLVATNLLA